MQCLHRKQMDSDRFIDLLQMDVWHYFSKCETKQCYVSELTVNKKTEETIIPDLDETLCNQ